MLVGNIGTLKAGVMAFPDASPTDGRLDVGVVTAAGLREWAAVLAKTVRRRPAESKHTTIGQGREIDVRLDGEHRFQLDGGTKGTTDQLHVHAATGVLDTVRSRVLNASSTSANQPHPTASPATMSVTQCTPSSARLVATATAMTTANAP